MTRGAGGPAQKRYTGTSLTPFLLSARVILGRAFATLALSFIGPEILRPLGAGKKKRKRKKKKERAHLYPPPTVGIDSAAETPQQK